MDGRRISCGWVTVVLFTCWLAAAGWAGPDILYAQDTGMSELAVLERQFEALADKVRPSVVAIRADRRTNRSAHSRRYTGYGSGFILSADGFILTNEHVVEGASSISVVLFNGAEYEARLVGADPRRDLAVLKIDADRLRPIDLGSHDDVRQGQFAFAFGNPYGLAKHDGRVAMAFGIISALGKNLSPWLDGTDAELRYYGNLIQTLMPIHPGNSGGPLLDRQGRVIGIIVAVGNEMDRVFGFAIPITDQTRAIIDTLKRGERVEYGMLGAEVRDPPRRASDRSHSGRTVGALVAAPPKPGTAADQAGLRQNDIIVEFNGTPVQDSDHLVRIVGGTPVGAEVELRCLRDGRVQTISVVLGKRSVGEPTAAEPEPEPAKFSWRGALIVERLTGEPRERVRGDAERELVVLKMRRKSAAFRAGLREMDARGRRVVITHVNHVRVRTIEEFRGALERSTAYVMLELGDGSRLRIPSP